MLVNSEIFGKFAPIDGYIRRLKKKARQAAVDHKYEYDEAKNEHDEAQRRVMDRLDCIDNLDRKILSIVMHNARIPSKDVAQVCGVSRAAIHQRIQRMVELGIITGSGYTVNPKLLGYSTCTYIGVNLERGAMYSTVVPELEKIPEVIECHFTTGPYTMLIKLFVRDNEHLMELLNKKIQMIPGVTGTETLISLDNSIMRQIPMHDPDEEK